MSWRRQRGEQINRVEYGAIRPALDALKPRWLRLIAVGAPFAEILLVEMVDIVGAGDSFCAGLIHGLDTG